MSPRAACRLEAFGFTQVYDYTAGIADWKAAGLAVDGSAVPIQRVVDAIRPDVPVCGPAATLGEARSRAFDAGWDECLVLDCDGIVVGRLRGKAWDSADGQVVERVMEAGPTTVRPDGPLQPLVERMTERGTQLVVASTPQGELLGVVRREDAARLLTGEAPEVIWQDCEGCPGRWMIGDGSSN